MATGTWRARAGRGASRRPNTRTTTLTSPSAFGWFMHHRVTCPPSKSTHCPARAPATTLASTSSRFRVVFVFTCELWWSECWQLKIHFVHLLLWVKNFFLKIECDLNFIHLNFILSEIFYNWTCVLRFERGIFPALSSFMAAYWIRQLLSTALSSGCTFVSTQISTTMPSAASVHSSLSLLAVWIYKNTCECIHCACKCKHFLANKSEWFNNFGSVTPFCPLFQFQCPNLQCIPQSYFCDGYNDCGYDGSPNDETMSCDYWQMSVHEFTFFN